MLLDCGDNMTKKLLLIGAFLLVIPLSKVSASEQLATEYSAYQSKGDVNFYGSYDYGRESVYSPKDKENPYYKGANMTKDKNGVMKPMLPNTGGKSLLSSLLISGSLLVMALILIVSRQTYQYLLHQRKNTTL